MSTATKAAPNGTWADLVPEGRPEPPHLITRSELLEQLEREGINVNARTLAFWESSGVLPRPIRRRHEGSIQALYPSGWHDIVQTVRSLQDQGEPLRGIPPTVWALAEHLFSHGNWAGTVYLNAVKALDEWARAAELDGSGPITHVRVIFSNDAGDVVRESSFRRPPGSGPPNDRA